MRIFQTIILFIIFYASLRGLLPLVLQNPDYSKIAIGSSFLFALVLSASGLFFFIFNNFRKNINIFGVLLVINLLIGFAILASEIHLEKSIDYLAFINFYIFPFSLFLIIYINKIKIIRINLIIGLILTLYLFYESYELNSFNNLEKWHSIGYFNSYERQKIIRPDTQDYFGRSGYFLITGGLLGIRQHWTGVFLAVNSSLFLSLAILNRFNFVYLLFGILFLVGVVVSQSGTNIIGLIVGILFILILYYQNKIRITNFRKNLILLILFTIAAVFYYFFQDYTQKYFELVYYRFSSKTGDWKGMLNFGNKGFNIINVFLGKCSAFKDCDITSVVEISYLGYLFSVGIFGFLIYMILLLYPFINYFFVRDKKFYSALLVPYFVILFSLLHYGTIYATTNIMQYVCILSILFKEKLADKSKGIFNESD